jgi:hypothetical protein
MFRNTSTSMLRSFHSHPRKTYTRKDNKYMPSDVSEYYWLITTWDEPRQSIIRLWMVIDRRQRYTSVTCCILAEIMNMWQENVRRIPSFQIIVDVLVWSGMASDKIEPSPSITLCILAKIMNTCQRPFFESRDFRLNLIFLFDHYMRWTIPIT